METIAGVEIGQVIEVTGEKAVIELLVDTRVPLAGEYSPGQPGSYVKIPVHGMFDIGVVSAVRAAGTSAQPDRVTADLLMIGTLDTDGRFGRGVSTHPNVGQKALMLTTGEVNEVFSEYVHFDFSFGHPVQAAGSRAYLHADRFFGRHVAILGTTGCGKSCTVASILQNVIRKYPDTHIIVLDLHGEYSTAFPEDVNLIETDRIELPYWLLNFDEFTDLTIDIGEQQAKNQLTVLRNSILQARQATDRRESLGLGNSVTVDSPIFYSLEDMLGVIRGFNIQMVPGPGGRLEPGPMYGLFDRFMIRFESRINDPRFKFMFAPPNLTGNANVVDMLRDYLSIDTGRRMTIVDLSGVPSEAVGVVVAVVSRLAFEFNLWNPERTRFPILMVYEEAHNYVPNRSDAKFMAPRLAVERIAKEGRKYGVGMMVVSQRPKELSETILASCNTSVVMRITNPDDQVYVKRLVPDSLTGLMDILPSLRTGESLILGDSVAMPVRVAIDLPDPRPMSADVAFSEHWADGIKGMDVDRVVRRWRARQKDL